jgi:hypothetical protein
MAIIQFGRYEFIPNMIQYRYTSTSCIEVLLLINTVISFTHGIVHHPVVLGIQVVLPPKTLLTQIVVITVFAHKPLHSHQIHPTITALKHYPSLRLPTLLFPHLQTLSVVLLIAPWTPNRAHR